MLQRQPGGWSLRVRVQPGAARSAVCGPHGDAIRIRLAAPAIEGRANRALIDFIAEALDVPRRLITIVSGEHARDKRLLIASDTLDPERLGPEWQKCEH
jgi:hypothetical protein